MSTIGIVLLVLVALLMLLLAAPVTLTLDVERVETFSVRWRFRWVYGLLRWGSGEASSEPAETVDSRGKAATSPDTETASEYERGAKSDDSGFVRERQVRPRPQSRDSGGRAVLAVLRTPGLAARVGTFARALAGRVRIERFRLRAAFGLSDPADTGIVYGWLTPVLVTANVYQLDVDCQPLFDEPSVRLTLNASVRVVPLAVVMTVLSFLVSPPVMRALLAARRARKA